MTLAQQITQRLDELAAARSDSTEQLLTASSPAGKLTCRVSAVDSLACAFLSLSLSSPRLANATVDQLKQLCGKLADRLNYLMEPVGVLEADEESCTVQMRSRAPRENEQGRSYYELLARRGGEILLQRYRKAEGRPRQVTPASLTREVFVHLCEDIVAAAEEM